MATEKEFIKEGAKRSEINEFLAKELARAGYGGMEMARTPMGTEITLKAEKPGMVIGKGGERIREVEEALEKRFELEDLRVDVEEVEEPYLDAQVVANKLANSLERGWHFRDAGRTILGRIMNSGALGAEITFSGKLTGARSRIEKFRDGYTKHCGEPAEEVVDKGKGVGVMPLGSIGVRVNIIPPDAELPDDFKITESEEILQEIKDKQETETEETETEETETEETETEEIKTVSNIEELEELSYRELQKIAKKEGIKANIKKEEMRNKIAKELDIE